VKSQTNAGVTEDQLSKQELPKQEFRSCRMKWLRELGFTGLEA
jgi:hypothetical protein